MSEEIPVGLAGRTLAQVFLPCTDLTRSRAFYEDTLGLPFLFETNGMAFFQLAGARLMLGELREGQPAMAGGGLYFDAPDLPALARDLEARGAVFRGPAQVLQSTPEGDLTLQSLLDPDGNLVALMGVVARV
ncbi:MAG: VOC family protein [Caulobacteraceae bacterium]|nr:VOC family protein [Caulobacteraceae bacterium]